MTDGLVLGGSGPDGWVLGVDLGTSHTVAMLRRPDGRTRPLLFDGRPLLPSAAYLDTTGRLHVGRDAVRLGLAEPGRFEPNPKRHVDAESVLLAGADVPTADLLAALLGAVAREAVAATGFLPEAVLTYPAAWGSRRREVLTTALARAGWPPATRLLPEPVAAARYFVDVLRRPVPVGGTLAVFDFGGGTLDIAVVRNEGPAGFTVAASGGLDDLGGLDLDAALIDHLGTDLRASEPTAWAALTDPTTLAQWRARRQFWDDVRGAKEMLSRTAVAPVAVPGVERAAHLTRDEFETVAGPLLRRAVTEAGAVIRAAGVAPSELAGLFLVGGSSRVPLVARLLHGELGIAPTVLEQPELPVAEGATIAVVSGVAVGGTDPGEASAPSGAAGEPAAAAGAGSSPDSAATPAEALRVAAVPPMTDTMAHAGPGRGGDPTGVDAGAGQSDSGAAQRRAPEPRLATEAMHPTAAGPATPPGAHPPAAASPGSRPAPAASPGSHPAPAASPGSRPAAAASQHSYPAPAGSPGAEPQYAEPVDPWATGEAAAFGDGHGGPILHPVSGGPVAADPVSGAATSGGAESWLASTEAEPAGARLPAYRRKWVWIVAAVTAVVVGVAATLVVVFWPGYRALDYRPLADLRRIPPAVPVTSAFNATAVRDGRAYFAGVDQNGTLGVVAAATDSGQTAWRSTAAGTAERWEFFFALPDALVAITDTDSVSSSRRMVLLDAGNGQKLWERPVAGSDEVLFAGDKVVLVDSKEGRVLGLGIGDRGKARWELRNPRSEYGVITTKVVAVTTEEDVAGPASAGGVPFAEAFDDDQRIVQVGADESVRVIDTGTGEVVAGPRPGVAQTDDKVIAHHDRLIVAESGDARRLFAYGLDKLDPKVLYTPAANIQLDHLTPCGPDQICFVETTGYDATTAQVVAVDAAGAGVVWRRAVAEVDNLVPVGPAVLARQSTSPDQVSLITEKGSVAWTRPGVVARLDGGNMLEFSKPLSASADDPALAGEHLGDDAVPLGALAGVRSSTCAWDTSHVACVADEDFVIQRFAG